MNSTPLRDKGVVLRINNNTQLDNLAKVSRKRQALVLAVFSASHETSVTSLDTRLLSQGHPTDRFGKLSVRKALDPLFSPRTFVIWEI